MVKQLYTCPQCGRINETEKCPECNPRRATPGKCNIIEAEGRCEEYPFCEWSETCLWFCAYEGWIGWKKEKEVRNGSSDDQD